MMHESNACAIQNIGTATLLATRMSQVTRRTARAALAALWKASEAHCEVTLPKYSHLLEDPADRR